MFRWRTSAATVFVPRNNATGLRAGHVPQHGQRWTDTINWPLSLSRGRDDREIVGHAEPRKNGLDPAFQAFRRPAAENTRMLRVRIVCFASRILPRPHGFRAVLAVRFRATSLDTASKCSTCPLRCMSRTSSTEEEERRWAEERGCEPRWLVAAIESAERSWPGGYWPSRRSRGP
jgi:hypothetical protein